MEGGEKGRARERQKQEFMGKKLKRGVLVGKRAGPCTPSPTWRLGFSQNDATSSIDKDLDCSTSVSARKLGANLWDIQSHLPVADMNRAGGRLRHHHHKDKGFELPTHFVDPPHSPPDQVTTLHSFIAWFWVSRFLMISCFIPSYNCLFVSCELLEFWVADLMN